MSLDLGARLAVARQIRSITQQQLAGRASVPQAQISRIERGDVAAPAWGTVVALAEALNVSLASLAAASGDVLLQELAGSGERDGILLGRNPLTRSPAVMDRWSYATPHMLICGRSGAGSSYTAKLQALREQSAGSQVRVICTEPGEWAFLGVEHLRTVRDRGATPHVRGRAIAKVAELIVSSHSPGTPLSLVIDNVRDVLGDTEATATLEGATRRARKQGVAMTLVLQADADALAAARTLTALCSTALLLRSHTEAGAVTQELFALSAHDLATLQAASPGDGLLITPDEQLWLSLRGTATAGEHALITARP